MILDQQNTFSAAQAFTSTGTTNSTNYIDFGTTYMGGDQGTSDAEILIQVQTAVTSANTPTLQFQFETANETAFDTTNVVLIETPTMLEAALTAGTQVLRAKVPAGTLRYGRINYVVATATLTGAAFDAHLVLDRQTGQGA